MTDAKCWWKSNSNKLPSALPRRRRRKREPEKTQSEINNSNNNLPHVKQSTATRAAPYQQSRFISGRRFSPSFTFYVESVVKNMMKKQSLDQSGSAFVVHVWGCQGSVLGALETWTFSRKFWVLFFVVTILLKKKRGSTYIFARSMHLFIIFILVEGTLYEQ